MASSNPLRELPSIDELLGRKELEALVAEHGRPLVKAAAQAALAHAREDVKAGFPAGDPVERTVRELEARVRPGLRRVLNATGVVVHTNLGRAPLAEAALARVRRSARGYSNLEYDLEAGSRGSRQDHLAAAAARADRRGGRDRRQQQRRRRPARASPPWRRAAR